MSTILSTVDKRTQLAGPNRFEMLIFNFASHQPYGINVFKVREIIKTPTLHFMPGLNKAACGIAPVRGKTVPIIDLACAVGLEERNNTRKYIIITEFNRSVQGFLVNNVDKIVNLDWKDVLPPPKEIKYSHVTAIAKYNDDFVQIIDVEKVLSEISGVSTDVSKSLVNDSLQSNPSKTGKVLVVDDSAVARKQVQLALKQVNIECITAKDGKEGFEKLLEMAKVGDINDQIDMVISDIEMPEMDGYTLTMKIKEHPNLSKLYVVLHSSLSGEFNNAMVAKVGANKFVAKYDPTELAGVVMNGSK